MATGHFFKSSADVGAPSLRNVAGDLIALLDWALDVATGTYWQKVYSGTNKAVYRATTGQRMYLRVDDTGTTQANVRGYTTMSDVDTGTLAFPTVANSPTVFFYKSNAAAARDWRIVGDSRFFLLTAQPNNNTIAETFKLAFGECTPYDPLDAYLSICWASSATASQYNTNTGTLLSLPTDFSSSASNAMGIANNMAGSAPSRVCSIKTNAWVNGGPSNPPFANAAVIAMRPVEVFDMGTLTSSVAEALIRGTIPYLYACPCTLDTSATPYNVDLTIGASTFRPYQGTSSNSGPLTLIRTSNDEPGRV